MRELIDKWLNHYKRMYKTTVEAQTKEILDDTFKMNKRTLIQSYEDEALKYSHYILCLEELKGALKNEKNV